MNITYRISFDLLKKYILVTMEITGAPGKMRTTLPAWIPGSYMIRDFARNIVTISPLHDSCKITKTGKQDWLLDACHEKVSIEYQVYANDLSVRSAHVDQTHAFFNGTSVFLKPSDDFVDVYHVEISRPADKCAAGWQVATTLQQADCDASGFGGYRAETYQRLIDCPFEIADLDACSFKVAGINHRMVFKGRHDADLSRLQHDLPPILEEHVALFDDLPIDQYLFMTTVTSNGYGGLEHCDSTALICARNELPARDEEDKNDDYVRYLGLCSHEYFHLWNVKRIKPVVFQTDVLDGEIHTPLLWAFEGITSYYDDIAMLRAGAIPLNTYLKLLAVTITRVLRGPGRYKQSIAESSFDAWTKFYKQDENAPNAVVSYYAKGSLVALGLDVELRLRSHDTVSLDVVMRQLWHDYGSKGQGIEEHTIQHCCEALLDESMTDFFDAYVNGTEELPIERWLAAIGIGFRLRSKSGDEDSGDALQEPPREPPQNKPALDAFFDEHPAGVRITAVFEDGMAQKSGLVAEDIVIAVDGYQVTKASLSSLVARLPLGASVKLHVFRDGLLLEKEMLVVTGSLKTGELWQLPESEMQQDVIARHHDWIASKR